MRSVNVFFVSSNKSANIGSANDGLSAGDRSSSEPMLNQVYVAIRYHQAMLRYVICKYNNNDNVWGLHYQTSNSFRYVLKFIHLR